MHEASKLVKQEELLNLLLLHIPLKQCAERLHVSYATIRKYASEDEFLNNLRVLSQSIYEEVIVDLKTERKTLQDRLLEASDKALIKLEALLESDSEQVVQKAADSILDRTIETARNRKVEGSVQGRFTIDPVTLMHAALTSQELQTAQKALPAPPPSYEKDGSSQPSE